MVLDVHFSGDQLSPVSATLSSTYTYHGNQLAASNCIDGDTGRDYVWTTWIHGYVLRICHTTHEPYPWLAIDYGKTFAIDRVEIFNRRGCCWSRCRNVEVRVSEELPTSGSQKFFGGSLLGSYTGPASEGEDIITISGINFCLEYCVEQTCEIIRQTSKRQVCHSADG